MALAIPTEESHTESAPRGRAPLWAEAIGTFFGAGYMRPGPGTWGSAGAVVTWVLVARHLPHAWLIPGAIFYAALATVVGIPAATQVARAMGCSAHMKFLECHQRYLGSSVSF